MRKGCRPEKHRVGMPTNNLSQGRCRDCRRMLRPWFSPQTLVPNPSRNFIQHFTQKIRPINLCQKTIQICSLAIAIVPLRSVSGPDGRCRHRHPASRQSHGVRCPCHMKDVCRHTFAAGRDRSKAAQKPEIPRHAVSAKMPWRHKSL